MSRPGGRTAAGTTLAGAHAPAGAPVTLLLAAAALVVAWRPELASLLEFDRERLGEPWRLLTCHLAHWDGDHLAWDLAMFVVLGLLLEPRGRGRLLVALGLGSLSVSLAVAIGATGVTTYRGLSGIDSMLFVLGLFALLEDARGRGRSNALLPAVLALGFAAKLVFECSTGHTLFVADAVFTPVPLAHVAGAGAGLGLAVVRWCKTR